VSIETVEGVEVEGEPVDSSSDAIVMPKWLWAILGVAVAGAVIHSVQLGVNSNRLDNVSDILARQQTQIDAALGVIADRGPAISEVKELSRDIEGLRELVTEVRDDVLTLKVKSGN